jgi:predicted ABC-type ATPase
MPAIDDDPADADVPLQIVQALTAAQQRWLQSGRTVVLVRDGQLVRILPDGTSVVIRPLSTRPRAVNRMERARSLSGAVPTVRMFAGPNGSGKTTAKRGLQRPPSWFGIDINPDELEATIRANGVWRAESLGMSLSADEVRQFFVTSPFLVSQNLAQACTSIHGNENAIDFRGLDFNSYHASVLADFLRREALGAGKSLTFETVMSSPDKVLFLRDARQRGFRTYLYYIATEDPEINVERVRNRVADGGHDVPEAKIRERYHRSIGLLGEAVRAADRAWLFDSSGDQAWFVAEARDGTMLELKSDQMPNWFSNA